MEANQQNPKPAFFGVLLAFWTHDTGEGLPIKSLK